MESKQRKHDRFFVQNNAYVSLGSGFTKVGSIKDISRGGVSFEYIMYDDPPMKSLQKEKIDIFVSGNGFHLTNVPCNIVYDIAVNTLNSSPLFSRNFTYKRCGIQFEKLDKDHEEQILAFLEKHTTGVIPVKV